MRIIKLPLVLVIVLLSSLPLNAQYSKQDSTFKKYFVGSTFFLLGNFAQNNAPDFAQLNVGYRVTGKDVVSLELKTWKYAWPLGIPYGSSYESPEEKFPGYIREFGFAFVYQKFFGRKVFAGIHVMNAWQSFVNEKKETIKTGFQLFNTYRLGYHVLLFNNKAFIQPSIAITHRPYHTEMPESFKRIDDNWPKLFFGEPGLHFGFNF